ncbi:putative transcription factor MYB-HB-like family [Medicago truncatula]|nr:putative transcription factor MYB-HB-like family [Medicago truncatula]
MSSSSSVDTKKGKWSKEEDEILKAYVEKHGTRNWDEVSKNTGLAHFGRSCRFRWYNNLRPGVKKGPFSKEEENKVFQLRKKFGGFKWSKIARELPGRTDNDIKNFWNARKRKHKKCGLSPFPDNMELDDELNGGSSGQQVEDSQENNFDVSNKQFSKLVDDSNMFYNNVGSTSTSNHTTSRLIDR